MADNEKNERNPKRHSTHNNDIHQLKTTEILRELREQLSSLVKKETDLMRTEIKADIKSEVVMISGLGVAAVTGFLTITMLLVTAIFALSAVIPGWLAGLIISGILLLISLIAGAIGWSRRVKSPVYRTRETVRDDFSFPKEKLA